MTKYYPRSIFSSPYTGTFLQVDFEYPDAVDGASKSKFIRAEDGNDYIIKGPSLISNHPLVAANELVAAQIAERLGLPVLPHKVIAMGPYLYFGSSRMQKNTFETLTKSLYRGCVNHSIIYLLVAFDVWLINGDRHDGNLLAHIVPGSAAPPDYALLANDHSHCFVWPTEDAAVLTSFERAPLDCSLRPPWVRISYVREDITDPVRMNQAISQVEGISDEEIDTIVASIPNGLIKSDERLIYATFLKGRKRRIRQIFRDGGALLPNLTGV